MIQPLGEVPERLLKQGENEFVRRSQPDWPIIFTSTEDGKVIGIEIKEEDGIGIGKIIEQHYEQSKKRK